MKTVKMFMMSFLVTALSISAVNANNGFNGPETQDELRASILEFLSDSERLIKSEARSATIKFLINETDELIVIGVDTDFGDIERFIKANLNYKKIVVDGVSPMVTYAVKVTFKDEQTKNIERSKETVNPLYDLSMSNFILQPSKFEMLNKTWSDVESFSEITAE